MDWLVHNQDNVTVSRKSGGNVGGLVSWWGRLKTACKCVQFGRLYSTAPEDTALQHDLISHSVR